MDRRIIGLAILALVIGVGVLFAKVTLVGILAAQYKPIFPPGITLETIEWHGIGNGLLFVWPLASVLGALLIACFKPRRWLLYSACASVPGVIDAIRGAMTLAQYDMPVGYVLLSRVLDLAMLPLFLWLFYAIIDRHTKTV